MLESKLWHKKTETKNVKALNMVEFINPCEQYPHKFKFGLSARGKKIFRKRCSSEVGNLVMPAAEFYLNR